MLFREFAAIFLAVMGCSALLRKQWRELAVWCGVASLGAGFYAFHFLQISQIVTASDPVSQGWGAHLGLAFALDSLAKASITRILGAANTPVIILCLVGWLGLRRWEPFCFMAGMVAATALFARPDNWYWAFILFPTLLGGAAFLPRYCAAVVRSARELGKLAATRVNPVRR